jgi:hypothetical protein
MFGLSKRELEEKFRRSEIAILAWRSQELSYKLSHSTGSTSGKKRKTGYDTQVEGLPDKFFNEEGEVDLRQVTGEEAYKYLSSIGMRLPIMHGRRGGK